MADNQFWKLESISKEDYWTRYESMRPKYADSFFLETIYAYHAGKKNESDSFDIAHDVACGAGKATVELARKFRHVIASDSNQSSLDAVDKLCTSRGIHNVRYFQCPAEDLKQRLPSRTTDLLTAAQSFPLFEQASALSSFAHVLKAQGTLAIWFYGRPHFTETAFKVECQPLFDRVLDLTFGKVIKNGDQASRITWKRAADAMESWLDNVDLRSEHWTQVQRWKWNSKSTKMGFGPEAVNFTIEKADCTGKEDESVLMEDSTIWKRDWDIHGVKDYISSSFPGVQIAVEADEEINDLLAELQLAMGGSSAMRSYTWPVVLILATRSTK